VLMAHHRMPLVSRWMALAPSQAMTLGSGGSLQGLVMSNDRVGVPGSATLGDASPSPRSSNVVGPGVSSFLLPSSPGLPPLPIY
jgi:hypothetical protein